MTCPTCELPGADHANLLGCITALQALAVRWVPVNQQLPDAEITVLVANHSGDVALGYVSDEDLWFGADATPITVAFWAELPEGPTVPTGNDWECD